MISDINNTYAHLSEQTISKKDIHDAGIFTLSEAEVILPDGKSAKRSVINHNGASCIIPVDGEDIIFVVQYRVAAGRLMLELPAGKLDSKNEDPYDCAKRELEEETGYCSDKITFLRKYIPAAGYSDEVIHIFTAEDLYKTQTHPDEDEFVEIERIPINRAYEMCLDGSVEDSKTIIGIMTYYDRYVRK